MSREKRAAVQIVLLILGTAMVCFGIYRGETAIVLGKAVRVCLECVGIG